jgi:hypothetical protein
LKAERNSSRLEASPFKLTNHSPIENAPLKHRLLAPEHICLYIFWGARLYSPNCLEV